MAVGSIILFITLMAALSEIASVSIFIGFDGLQCVRPEFVETYSDVSSKLLCARLCNLRSNCQAFSVADGPCQLFVFHRCSKYVRDCSCSRRVQVFVKQQPGLPPGAMCPIGFTDDLCGTKYKFYGVISDWNVAKAAVDAEPGLTIMADVTDDTEMTHLYGIFSRHSLACVLLGGLQAPGSAEPAGGWYWVSCNISIDSTLWASEQPDNYIEIENYTSSGTGFGKLNDGTSSDSSYAGAFGECVAPFG